MTAHAYRSWNADHPRGYVQRGEAGVQESNEALGRWREGHGKHPPVRFTRQQQKLVCTAAIDIAARRGWRLHALGVTPTHYHLLVGIDGSHVASAQALSTFKRLIGLALSKAAGTRGRPWHSRGGEPPKRIGDRAYFHHLLNEYLPKHVGEGGIVWREGEALP